AVATAAHRQSAGESRHPQPHRLDQPGEIRRRRFAFEIRISREDELGDRSVIEPSQQLPHPEVVGADSLDRADRPAEHVVPPMELARLLDRDDIFRFFDHTNDGEVASRVAADAALRLFSDVAADLAEPHLFLYLKQNLSKTADGEGIGRKQVEGDSLRTLRTDVGQPAQLIDQILDDAFVHPRYSPRLGRSRPLMLSPSPPRLPPRPSVSGPMVSAARADALLVASRTAARMRSARLSVSSGSIALGSITRSSSSPVPLTVAVTSPPPAVPSTSASASCSSAAMSGCCMR